MRPVNLIPPEERRGEQAPLRSGPLAYIFMGALVALLIGVATLVLTNNQISSQKAEIATLETEDRAARERAERLSAYISFRDVSEKRVETVASLADSRFDWERVMRELALILPSDVWLVSMEASAAGSGTGPSLQLSGCAKGQRGVAGFVTALKDIDGVTRVSVQSSELPASSGGAGSGGGEDCRTRPTIAKFSILATFDAAPVSSSAGLEAAPETEEPEATEEGEATETSTETEGG